MSEAAMWCERWIPRAAMAGVLGLLAVASAVMPAGVDAVPTDLEQALEIVHTVSTAPERTRIGFFAIVGLMGLLAPAVRPVRRLAPTRGAVCTEVGYRLLAVGSFAAAVGNAFAPLVLPSTVGLNPVPMAQFVMANSAGSASYAILAVYALLPIGAVVLTVGLLRARTAPVWGVLALGVGIMALMPTPAGPLTAILVALLAVGFGVVVWPATRGEAAARSQAPATAPGLVAV